MGHTLEHSKLNSARHEVYCPLTDQDTINVEAEAYEERTLVRTPFQLLVTTPGGERAIPVCYARTQLGGPGAKPNDLELEGLDNRQASLAYQNGKLFFTNHAGGPCLLNGEPATFGELADRDELQLGSHRVRVRDASRYPGSLESYPDPVRSWVLPAEDSPVGRGGKRVNRVELDDPTVSRAQATFLYRDGQFSLLSETSSSPTRVNGEKLTEGQPQALQDGDLVQFGKVMLRFRRAQPTQERRELLAQEATILFSDIWNYSTLAENRPLEDTILQMNEFYRGMGKVIEAHGGVLMTFLGDAMMAVFGSEGKDPAAPSQAVRCALAMQRRLCELNAEWSDRGLPTMRIGVGINTGEVMVGHVGFTGRYEFAAMGDNTNLAARLEKLTRQHEASIIISGSTQSALESGFVTKSLGATQVKGRQAETQIYQVLDA